MKLSYPLMDGSIDELFEPDRARSLRVEIQSVSPKKREETVLEAVREAIRQAGGTPVVYAFRTREGGGTSHHLVFASKHLKGVGAMKRIMTQASSAIIDGVGSWDFDPSDEYGSLPLFSPLDQVRERLLSDFPGRTLTFEGILQHQADRTQYTETNYRDALLGLETEGRIDVVPPAEERRPQAGKLKRTLPLDCQITFHD